MSVPQLTSTRALRCVIEVTRLTRSGGDLETRLGHLARPRIDFAGLLTPSAERRGAYALSAEEALVVPLEDRGGEPWGCSPCTDDRVWVDRPTRSSTSS